MTRYNIVFIISIILLAACAVFLRSYRFIDTVAFRPDQASDLYIARSIVENGNRPVVGPLLSVKHFSVPPTYYYILAGVYRFTRSPDGATVAFVIMNLLAMCCMVFLATLLMDRTAGVIMAALFATSFIMVSESRMMWQPHPVTLCITVSLVLLFLAFQKKSIFALFISLLAYTCALSIYVSPIVLLPFYIYVSTRFFHNVYTHSCAIAVLCAIGALIVAGIPIFYHYVLYEISHALPTYTALGTSAFRWPTIDIGIRYLGALFDDVFANPFVQTFRSPFLSGVFETAVIGSFIMPFIRMKKYSPDIQEMVLRVRKFLASPWLFIGFLFTVFFQRDINAYRIHPFVPFIFLWFTLVIRSELRRPSIFLLLIALVSTMYVFDNITQIYRLLITYDDNDVHSAATIAFEIGRDAALKGIRHNQMEVVAYRFDAYNNYPLFPYAYYLRDMANYSLPIVPLGNDTDRSRLDHPQTPYVYLICRSTAEYSWSLDECKNYFVEQQPSYHIVRSVASVQTATALLYKREASLTKD